MLLLVLAPVGTVFQRSVLSVMSTSAFAAVNLCSAVLFVCACYAIVICIVRAMLLRRRLQVARDIRSGKIKVPSRSAPVLDCDGKFKFPSPVLDSSVSVCVNDVKVPVSAPVTSIASALPSNSATTPINLTTAVPLVVNIIEASASSVQPVNVAVLTGSVPARPLSHINVSLPISPDITIEVEDWIDSPVSSSVPMPAVRVKRTKKRKHRPAPVPFVNIVEVPASSILTVNADVPAGSVPASIDHDVNVLPNIDASAVFPVGAPVSPVAPDVLARCLSPGPFYDGPAIDRESLPWPLSVCPDWPSNAEWLDLLSRR